LSDAAPSAYIRSRRGR